MIKMVLSRLRIRFERCPNCNKRMINYGYNLHFDLYNEEINNTYCKKCAKIQKEVNDLSGNKENCFNCKNLTQNKKKNYSCLFKKCQMGIKPFFPKEIPEDRKINYGIEVCKFEPKTKEKGVL